MKYYKRLSEANLKIIFKKLKFKKLQKISKPADNLRKKN